MRLRLAALFATILVASPLLLPLIIGFGKTGKKTTILGRDYSILDKSEIIRKLDRDFPLPPSLTLTFDSRQFLFSPASVSAALNQSHLAASLLFRRLNQGLGPYITAFFSPRDYVLDYSYDDQLMVSEISRISAQINRPFVPSEISLGSDHQPQIKEGQLGFEVDDTLLESQLLSLLNHYQVGDSVDIPVKIIGQLPDSQSIQTILVRARHLPGRQLVLSTPDQKIILGDDVLVSWLGFDSVCNQNKVNEYLDGLTQSVKKDPIDAVFKFENGRVTEFRSAQSGYHLDVTSLRDNFCSRFSTFVDQSEPTTNYDLPTIIDEAKIKNTDVNDLGIKELLGRGTSSFRHSSATRNFNVEKGASIINRILVAPGQTFSFIQNLGQVTLESGFKKAYVIKKGKTELDVGGGICQVSTTLFRAMFNAGLDITARTAHAYRVQYYEEDSKPGFDATVFIPSPDLKFKNDTSHYLLIQSQYDGKNKKLTYEVYGTSDGRQVEITNYRQWDATPAPPDVYIDDPTLPPGKIVQDEHRIPGLKTAFDWKVTRNSEIIHQKIFQSSYVPWAAVYRRGPIQ